MTRACVIYLALGVAGLAIQEAKAEDLPPVTASVGYAEAVIRYLSNYSNGCGPTNAKFKTPENALGAPNYTGGSNGTGAVSLGSGGLIELEFRSALLSNSGNRNADIWIYEVGPAVEACQIFVRPLLQRTSPDLLESLGLWTSGDGFYYVGTVAGATAYIDIDAMLNRVVAAGSLVFDAIRIVDVKSDNSGCGDTAGADLDAVGALYTVPPPPLPVSSRAWGEVKGLYR